MTYSKEDYQRDLLIIADYENGNYDNKLSKDSGDTARTTYFEARARVAEYENKKV